jgi:Ca2+-binding RTX toxin-like protein
MAMATINGTGNADVLDGTSGDDTIHGDDGNDIVKGGDGNDFLYGDAGDDRLEGGSGSNDYFGGAGNDIFVMSARGHAFSDDLIHDFTPGSDRIDVSKWGVSDISQIRDLLYVDRAGDATFDANYGGQDHMLRIAGIDPNALVSSDFHYSHATAGDQTGTTHDDVMFGSTGDDVLRGGAGDDVLLGGKGDDTLIGGFGLDDYDGGQGFDKVSYAYSDEAVNVNLASGVAVFGDGAKEYLKSIEAVAGSSADNVLTGTAGHNILDGEAGNDTLKGQGGDDILIGDAGADKMSGGAGNDLFQYAALGDSTVAASGRDTITDFATGDHIGLTKLEAATGESFTFTGTAAFSHIAGELHYQIVGGNTLVSLDSNGDGAADFAILLSGVHTLTAGDFLL